MQVSKLIQMAMIGSSALLMAGSASAAQVFSQAQLASILGGNETMEDFEGNGMLGSGQIFEGGGLLNSSTTFGGYGPGLVQGGVDYSGPAMWWNDHGYFNLNTRTLGDCSGWRGYGITLTYTSPVTAFGFDMQGYSGYSMVGIVDVYDTSNNLITSSAVNGGFFGWENAAGIGSVVVNATGDGYIMLDNHGYGAAVPEPATMAVLGLGAAALLRRRRKA